MTDRKRKGVVSQKGVALIMALVILFLLSALAASLIFVTQSEMWASANYRLLTQSRYAAEAGAQAGVNWFRNTYTPPSSLASYTMTASPVTYSGNPVVLGGSSPNYPDNTVKTAFTNALTSQSVAGLNNATYSVTATLMQMQSAGKQSWQITSVGNITGARGATTQVVETVQSNMTPTFQYGLYATGTTCESIIIEGGSTTDGYNSNLGAYGGANVNTTTGGSVGTSGNVLISGGSHIDGNVYTPNASTSGACSSGSVTGLTNSGGTVVGSEDNITPPNYANPPFESPYSPGSGVTSYNSTATLGPGTYNSIATSGGGSLVTFSGGGTYTLGDVMIDGVGIVLNAGTYYVNSFTASGGATVTIASGPVILNINPNYNPTIPNGTWPNNSNPNCTNNINSPPFCPFDVQGGSTIVNNLSPAMFEIAYGGSSNIVLSGGSHAQGVVYAPSAQVTVTGGSPWSGGIIGQTINNQGGSSIHYDTALQNNFPMGGGGFTMTGFTWSKN